MHYLIKSLMQNSIDLLPPNQAYKAYYKLQREFGGLKNINPLSSFLKGKEILYHLRNMGIKYKGKSFLEIGSGRSLILPVSLFIQGIDEIVTVDINPYFSIDIWQESLLWASRNYQILEKELPGFDKKRLRLVMETLQSETLLDVISKLNSLGIRYIAPCNASILPFKDDYFDFHISTNVLEHIQKEDIIDILIEGKRVLSKEGIFFHGIDFVDHFSYTDPSISKLHFLRFSKTIFKLLSHNRFGYVNRLRDSEFRDIFDQLNLKTIYEKKEVDTSILELL